MDIIEFVKGVPGFYKKSAVEQLLILVWFGHEVERKEHISLAWLKDAFSTAGLKPPNLSLYADRLAKKRPPQIYKLPSGIRLSPSLLSGFRKSLIAKNMQSIQVSALLSSLPDKVSSKSERVFLEETLTCYRSGSFRASIVMAWNLAYSHLIDWLFLDQTRLASFNAALMTKFPKNTTIINNHEDLQEFKESDVIEVMRVGRLLDKNRIEILREKLKKRNAAAHPSRHTISQHQADDVITDLVNNIVLSV